MKKIAFVVGKDYQENRIFDLSNKQLNRDNCLLPFFLLKKEFQERGYELLTADQVSIENADLVLCNEMPKPFSGNYIPEKSFLMLFETELIRKDNWDLSKHAFFKKIFTWNDSFVDHKKYIKFNFPNEFRITPPSLNERPGFLVSISGNKTSKHPLELYSKRKEAIDWFEKNHPDDLDYYGIGWDYKFDVWWQKLFRKLHVLQLFPKNQSACYKGIVREKQSVLQKYKFSLCFENGRDIDGYITEKIWDCFFAGTVPVYWGAGNLNSYIPENCYVDFTKFKSIPALYKFLKSLRDEDVLCYQRNIEIFLKSEGAQVFTNEFFAKNIVREMLDE